MDVEREADELKYSQYNGVVSSRYSSVKGDSIDNSLGSSERKHNESDERQISKNNSEKIQTEAVIKPKD